MSIQGKGKFKKLSRIAGIGLFTLLMLTNIKLALLDDTEITNGDISILGVDISVFQATYGETTNCCIYKDKYICAATYGDYIDYRPCD